MSDDYKFQASFKFGSRDHMLNFRAGDISELSLALSQFATQGVTELLAQVDQALSGQQAHPLGPGAVDTAAMQQATQNLQNAGMNVQPANQFNTPPPQWAVQGGDSRIPQALQMCDCTPPQPRVYKSGSNANGAWEGAMCAKPRGKGCAAAYKGSDPRWP